MRIEIDKRRKLGDLLVDPFRLIFSRLGAIMRLSFTYNFIPIICSLAVYLYFTDWKYNSNSEDYDIIFGALGIVAYPFFIAHLFLISTTIVVNFQSNFENNKIVTYETLHTYFKKSYARNWNFFGWTFLGILLFSSILGMVFLLSPSTGQIIGLVLGIFLGFFLFFAGITWYIFAYFHFITNVEISFRQAFVRTKDYIQNQWAESLGAYLSANFISSMISYFFAVPFALLVMMLALFVPTQEGSNVELFNTGFTFFLTAFSLILFTLYSTIVMFLKYFDTRERLESNHIKKQIENFSLSSQNYFENEGEY